MGAATAAMGDALALWGPVSAYQPAPGCRWQLLVGDETALPAIGAIVEALPAGVRAEVIVEVSDAADEQRWATAGDVRVTWLHRDGSEDAVLAAVSSVDIPADAPRCYAWIAGEQSMARAVRAHLVQDRRFDREDVYFSGYWRRGKSENED
ncbi:siderophore-interacting protein [Fodinicola feengrottensis]|uniref:siderophore-interacting protein n=1 Tax=Fodinicola feengrottensis TaxID=435914 RepID=UPI0024436A7A|nr:siderophore-interacting protein [Fodinicola feengrottensis]